MCWYSADPLAVRFSQEAPGSSWLRPRRSTDQAAWGSGDGIGAANGCYGKWGNQGATDSALSGGGMTAELVYFGLLVQPAFLTRSGALGLGFWGRIVLQPRFSRIRREAPNADKCSPGLFEFPPVESRHVVASFDGGAITSDAGALLLGQTDRAIQQPSGCRMLHRYPQPRSWWSIRSRPW